MVSLEMHQALSQAQHWGMIPVLPICLSDFQTFILTYAVVLNWVERHNKYLATGPEESSVLVCTMWLICSAVSSIVSRFSLTHSRRTLYRKHTGPISMPNSWSGPPMSTGAMSTIGSLAVFCVLYSNTVLPQLPFACCKRQDIEKLEFCLFFYTFLRRRSRDVNSNTNTLTW